MHAVGIDLGTTFSLIAHLDGETPRIIPNALGQPLTPSVVGVDPAGRILVGSTARDLLLLDATRAVADVKRLMGSAERLTVAGRVYTPTEISAFVLRSLVSDAETHLGARIAEAVITVPAYFTDAQRQATKDAGELAGLRVERIINEPTAAALAYGLGQLDKEQHVLVYDLGGGTFDVSVLEMFEGVLEVRASSGDSRLGGTDFDRVLVDWLVEQCAQRDGLDPRRAPQAMARLKLAAEQAKIELSGSTSTWVRLPALLPRNGSALDFECEVTRAQLERLIAPLVQRTFAPVASALADARLTPGDVTEVVLVGGSTRVPLVRRLVSEYFGRAVREGVDAEQAVALGAALQAGLKSGAISSENGIMITDVAPFTLGVEIQARAGSQQMEGLFSPIIERNSTVPVSRTETYSTTHDGQTRVDIRVFQGEGRFVRQNVFLDQYSVDGIPRGPAGTEKVAVTFAYDINGILKVTTRVVSTGKEAHLVVDRSPCRMSPAELELARGRLDGDWSGPDGAVPPAPSELESSRRLLEVARRKLATLSPPAAGALGELVAAAERALAQADRRTLARIEAQLTDMLFALD